MLPVKYVFSLTFGNWHRSSLLDGLRTLQKTANITVRKTSVQFLHEYVLGSSNTASQSSSL